MMTEEEFLCDLYYKYDRGDIAEGWVANKINEEITWVCRGSTVKAKRVLSNLIASYADVARTPSTSSMIEAKLSALKEALNEIIQFQKQTYLRGNGH